MKRKGNAGENRVAREMREDGFIVASTRETNVGGDLLGVRLDEITQMPEIRIVECKANLAGGPYKNFAQVQRQDCLYAAKMAGGTAWLAYAPPNAPTRWIPASEWP